MWSRGKESDLRRSTPSRNSRHSPSQGHIPRLTEEHNALLPLCFPSGVASPSRPLPHTPQLARLPTYPCNVYEHLGHPGPFARDAQIQQHSGHFQAKGISSVPSAFTSPSRTVGFLPLVYFLQTLHYVDSMKCSHCIASYLYLYLAIP